MAVKSRKTIAATGATGSGKTTLLRRLGHEIPPDERLVTIEDTAEFGDLPIRNRVSLFYGAAGVTAEKAVETSLRLRPDRIMLQELRGAEAFAFLRALAAGHPGSLSTWHSSEGEWWVPLSLMAKQHPAGREIPDEKLEDRSRADRYRRALCTRPSRLQCAQRLFSCRGARRMTRAIKGAAATALNVVLGCAGAVAAWELGTSAMWAKGTSTPFSPLAWWYATQWFGANWWATLWIVLAPVVPTIVCAMALFVFLQYRRLRRSSQPILLRARRAKARPIEQAVTDNFGHSTWRTPEEAARLLFPGPHPQWGGIVVGEVRGSDPSLAGIPFDSLNRNTWGPKVGKAPLMIDPCTRGSGHSCIFAGSGAFKSSAAVCTVLTWTGASVVMDPSTEIGPMLDKALRERGKEVFHIGIPSEEQPDATGFNVLNFIDITHPEAELHVQSVVDWIYDTSVTVSSHKGEDPFFAPMGRQLLLCLLAHLVWADPKTVEISLATLADALAMSQQDMLDNLRGIATISKSPLAKRIAKTLADNTAPETFAGVALNCAKGTSWLFTEAYADLVSRGRFNPKMLLAGKTTVFLNVSLRTLETTPAIARVLVGSLLNAMYMAEGRTGGKVLFLIDEAARLGHLRALVTARDTGRKYSVCLHLLWQSLGQMTEIWGRDGTRAWIDACDWLGFAAVRAGGAGKELSEQLGGYGVLARSEGDNQGRQMPFGLNFGTASKSTNVNVHEISRRLATASELQQDLRADEIIIVPASGMPVRCGRALWFARAKMAAVVARNRFAPNEKEKVNA